MSRHITFIYMYLYLIWEQFLFFHTNLIVQAYGQLGHRVQDSASTLDSLTSSEVDKVIAQPLATVRGETLHLVRSVRQVSQTGFTSLR